MMRIDVINRIANLEKQIETIQNQASRSHKGITIEIDNVGVMLNASHSH
jgi:hypothetical protein